MARAVRAGGAPRLPALPSAERGNYFKEVWEELKKVVWPTRGELTRMTGIVIATVIIFAGIIGIVDYGLGLVVKQLYAAPGQRPPAAVQQPPVTPSTPPPVRRTPSVPIRPTP